MSAHIVGRQVESKINGTRGVVVFASYDPGDGFMLLIVAEDGRLFSSSAYEMLIVYPKSPPTSVPSSGS